VFIVSDCDDVVDADSNVDQSESERPSLGATLGGLPTCSLITDRLGPTHQRVGGMIRSHVITITRHW